MTAAGKSAGEATTRPSPKLVIFVLWLLVFGAASQTMIVAPILPRLGRALDVPETLYGTLVSAYSLMVGVFAVLSGPVSDRIGRRRILLLGSGLLTATLFLHALPGSYAGFLAVRLLAGVAGGILSGAAVSYVGDFFPYLERGWAIGWVMSGSAFGQVVGIPLGILMADHLGVAAPFLAFGVTTAATFGLILRFLPQPDVPRSPARLSVSGAVKGYGRLLARPGVASAALGFLLLSFGVAAYLTYLPTWLEASLGAGGGAIATLFLVGGVASVVGGPWAGALSDRMGRRRVILASCGALTLAVLATPLAARGMTSACTLFFLAMLLVAMRQSPYSALLTGLVEARSRGALLSLAVALGQLGFALGSGLAGPLYASRGYGSNAVMAAASVVAMALVVALRVPEGTGVQRSGVDAGIEAAAEVAG